VDWSIAESDARSALFQQLTHSVKAMNDVIESQWSFDRDDPVYRRHGGLDRGAINTPIGTHGPIYSDPDAKPYPYDTEEELSACRSLMRSLARENSFAKAAHLNRENYVCGWGTQYTATSKPGVDLSKDSLSKVQGVIDAFLLRNKWSTRKPNILTRGDRDGECFLRTFVTDDGIAVRFVEPESVYTPLEAAVTGSKIEYGIERDPDDSETVIRYWINGKPVDAAEIQHRKRGDMSAPRGTPILWAARRHLLSAQKILRNGSAVTEIQTAVGMIRKIANTTKATIQSYADASANVKVTNNTPGYGTADTATTLHQRIEPGTILNAGANMDYIFPGMGVDPAKYVESEQAELRAAAASVNMPEWMFSAKSDDVNRAAAFTTEGPSTKAFERLQYEEGAADIDLIERDLDLAVGRGLISQSERVGVTITLGPPQLVARNRESEAKVRQADIDAGILSIQTATAEAGYNYDQEQANMEAHQERTGAVRIAPQTPIDNMPSPPDDTQSTEWDETWNEVVYDVEASIVYDEDGNAIEAASNVTLNKPFRTPDGPKKFAVYVKNDKGNVVKVTFGDPNMEIKRDDPERRKAYRSRHQCDTNPGPKWKANYWSCKFWDVKSVSELLD
jgi:hypothetical protein